MWATSFIIANVPTVTDILKTNRKLCAADDWLCSIYMALLLLYSALGMWTDHSWRWAYCEQSVHIRPLGWLRSGERLFSHFWPHEWAQLQSPALQFESLLTPLDCPLSTRIMPWITGRSLMMLHQRLPLNRLRMEMEAAHNVNRWRTGWKALVNLQALGRGLIKS